MHKYAIATVCRDGADWTSARPLEPVALTAVQCRIYEYVRSYQTMWGDTPLYREIADACGLKTESSVQYQIRRLVQLGLMRKPPRLVRAIRISAVPVKVI